jgi:membrane protein YqaA with SNARE-associated domain
MCEKKKRTYIIASRIVGVLLIFIVGLLFLIGGRSSRLAGYFVYTVVACTFIPLPTTPYVIGMGKVFHPGIVAFVGAIGNCLAAWIEYYALAWLFSKTELQQKIGGNWFFQKFARFFQRAAFACLVFTGFSAIPFEPFRLAAILIRYPMRKYLLSVFIGRIPRYYLVAIIGNIYQISNQYLMIMVILMITIPLISHYIGQYISTHRPSKTVKTKSTLQS